jgi:hypothetical protein
MRVRSHAAVMPAIAIVKEAARAACVKNRTMDDDVPSPLAALTARAAADQWTLDAIDWSVAPRPPRFVPRRLFVAAASQLLHGEALALALCDQLLDLVDDPVARAFLALQRQDEARHVAAYHRYFAQLGALAPPLAGYAAVEAAATASRDPLAIMLALHVVLEHEALALHRDAFAPLGCPLLCTLMARVDRDEARHVAFGRLYLPQRLAGVAPARRRALASWLAGLWRGLAEEARATLLPAFLPFPRALVASRWAARALALEAAGLPEAAEAAP